MLVLTRQSLCKCLNHRQLNHGRLYYIVALQNQTELDRFTLHSIVCLCVSACGNQRYQKQSTFKLTEHWRQEQEKKVIADNSWQTAKKLKTEQRNVARRVKRLKVCNSKKDKSPKSDTEIEIEIEIETETTCVIRVN